MDLFPGLPAPDFFSQYPVPGEVGFKFALQPVEDRAGGDLSGGGLGRVGVQVEDGRFLGRGVVEEFNPITPQGVKGGR